MVVVELLVLLSLVLTRSLSFFNVCFSLLLLFEFSSAAASEEGPSSSARPKCTMTTILLPGCLRCNLGMLFREQGDE